MAGGRNNSEHGGILDRTCKWLRHHRFHTSVAPEAPSSRIFKERQRIEESRTVRKNISLLQDNILRIFTDSLYCDFNIIYGYNVIRTNQCIVRTRTPHFYEVLKPYFVYTNKVINCILDTPGLYHQIEGFTRLLYSNLDLSQEEQLLVDIILNIRRASTLVNNSDTAETSIGEREYKTCVLSSCNIRDLEPVKGYAELDVSPASSEMADSGLETGSVSPHENTTSESSSTDFGELQTGEYASASEDLDKIHVKQVYDKDKSDKTTVGAEHDLLSNISGRIKDLVDSALVECMSTDHSATCSSVEAEQQQLDLSSSSTEYHEKQKLHPDEIFQYENRVLSEPFYESDCGSDENESFEFINQPNALCTNPENKSEQCKLPEKMQAAELKSAYLESKSQGASINTYPIESVPKSSSSATNHYFIDASTLNDEIDIITADTTQKDKLSASSLPSDSYVPSYDKNKSSNSVDDQSCKFTTRKATTFQTAHERVAEFQRELKLTEYLQPLTEPRKIKKLDSISDDKNDVDKGKDKESLAVEIKEMDSGESTQPSPCPDNNTKLNNGGGNAENTMSKDNTVEASITVEEKAKLEDKHECPDEDTRRPSLIRRNTFELDSNDEKLSVLRQEYERRQGNLVFQNAIPQYSGHRVDGDSFFNPPAGTAVPAADDAAQYSSDIQLPVNSQYCALPSYISLEKCKHNTDQRQSSNSFLVQDTVTQPTLSYPMSKSASDKLIVQCGPESDNASNSSSSLPVTLNSILEKELTDSVKRTKRDETTPIISGGVSTSDYSKPTDSPTVRRKTESTPIVSGGSVIMVEPAKKTKTTRMSTSMTAWVVDMSDCNKTEQKSSTIGKSQADMSQSFSTPECVKKPTRRLSGHEKHGSLGFFVNLKDMDSQQEASIKKDAQKQDRCTDKRKHNEHNKPYCEFYIDITKANTSKTCKKSERDCVNSKIEKPTESGDKKNIFSMFIDLSDPHKTLENNTKTSQKQSSSMLSDKKLGVKRDDANNSENSSTTCDDQSLEEQKSAKERTKPSVFMFIESDSPVVRRRTLSSSRPAFKRHSWNVDKTQNSNGSSSSNGYVAKELILRKEHKRAHSLSVDRGDLKKLQAKPSSSSHSLSDAARAEPLNPKNLKTMQDVESNLANNMDTSSEDVFEFDIRDTPPNSHVEVINEELRSTVKQHDYKELTTEIPEVLEGIDSKLYEEEYSDLSAWEKTCTESIEGQTRKSETFDISSGSGPSPGSDNHEYVLSDLLNGEVPNIADRSQTVPAVASKISETHKSLNETIKKIECELTGAEHGKRESTYKNHTVVSKSGIKELQTSTEKISCNFVRLSDLDKTPVTSHVLDSSTVKEEKPAYRMSNSIPETSWIESKLVMSRANGPVRPFSRKFPSIMSTSLPSKQKSPMEDLTGECEGEGIISESDLSSMQSSMGRSGAEGSTEETETSSLAGAKPYNRLGEDLLRMFLEEINPDITIDVDGRRIRAHKCILSSRCQYFAAILSGGWIESAGNIISLQGYSYDAVHFALCHIYSGESNIPDYISIVELATLADMLCLEGLKEVIGYTLKVKYCHLFHKPCEICAIGVLACMPVAAAYGLDEVYRKSLRWITRHFVRIWPCKTFATLPKELMEKCYHQHIVYMSTDNVLQTMMDCDKLLAILPNERWAEPVFRMASNLLETSVKFLSNNFSSVLGSENFQSLGRELTWNISRLEDKFLAAAERLPPEQACKSYSKLHKMLDSTHTEESQAKLKWCSLFVDFLLKVQSRVEKCLVRDATRAAHTTMWLKMDLELRRRIQELACLVILPHETSKRQSRHSNFLKEARPSSSRSTTSRSLDLKRVKMAISEHTDKALKQITVTQQSKKILNKPKSDPLERKMQEDKQATTDTTNRPKSWPNKLEVKSRYLEPRNKSVPKETTSQVQQEKIIPQQRRKIMISSSDSSRTSSPAMKRATEKKPLAKLKLPVKKDVKALSSDSLTESTVSRGTRKDLISKSCGITRPESPSFKQKGTEIGLSVDSLAESKNKPVAVQKKANKMDTSMSTDSLMTEITTTPKSNTSNKLSPTLNKGVIKTQIYDRVKKSSPPMQQRSPLSVTRRPPRSLENSTAASRSRAAAINAYHGSPSLRRNLLDAAKTPDIPSKPLNSTSRTITVRQGIQSATASANLKREKKDGTTNAQGSESPNKKLSPKLSGTSKTTKSGIASKRTASKTTDDKTRTKCHNGDTPKQPTVGSRSGTFLKDEPTILKKADIKSSEINT